MEYRKELQDYIDTVELRNGSDIHLIVDSKPLFREKRELIPFIQKSVLTKEDTVNILKLIIPDNNVSDIVKHIKEKKHILFGYKTHTTNEVEVNFRVTAYLESGKIAIAFRLIKENERTIEELGLPQILKNLVKEPSGLFLVVGPTGNGKSTTLAAMINHCNNSTRKHILTIEDPVEYIFKNKKSVITQREVPADVTTFRSALDNALRADADILMIGEMREIETIKAAVTAAEVGHLVLSTLHSNSAGGTIHRIIDSFPANQQKQIANQLSYSLLGVCSIRLLPKVGGGLIPACEILINNSAVANVIREGRIESIGTIIQTGSNEGMKSLDQALAELVKKNEISLETANLYSTDTKVLNRYL